MTSTSVIVCTHNPRLQFLEAVLGGLRSQTLATSQWELCVVDNASTPSVATQLDLSWHPRARVLREEQLGLTHARVRGIDSTTGELVVFVDDDNVLDSDYLEVVQRLARKRPMLGAWGGRVIPEFESPPPEWTRPYWSLLANRDFGCDHISSPSPHDEPTLVGAGLCVRRTVASTYAQAICNCALRSSLGRRGTKLLSAEDLDLVLTACDLGMQRGHFRELRLRHLIPPSRLTVDYLAQLSEELLYSHAILRMARDPGFEPPRTEMLWKLKWCWTCVTKFGRKRQFHLATKRGQWRVRRFWESRSAH